MFFFNQNHYFRIIGIVIMLFVLMFANTAIAAESTSPAPRDKEYSWMSIAQWQQKHSAIKLAAKNAGEIDILFVGDSITEGWQWGDKQAVFKQYFEHFKTLNMGIGGDQTQNVMWRLKELQDANLQPKIVNLLIGVNNFGHSNHNAEQVFSGVQAIVAQLKSNYPQSKILINAIFPFDASHSSSNRQRVNSTNKLIANLASQEGVHFVDFGHVFLNQQGDIEPEIMADFLHPTAKGYQLYAEQLLPVIKELIQ